MLLHLRKGMAFASYCIHKVPKWVWTPGSNREKSLLEDLINCFTHTNLLVFKARAFDTAQNIHLVRIDIISDNYEEEKFLENL